MPRASSRSRAGAWVAAAFLVAGLALRSGIFALPHLEGDERIYAALLDQLRAGHGYTLRGSPVLEQDWMVREQYDTPLFYHPPGGIAWFWLFTAIFGPRGLDVAQLAAFAVFFAGTLLLAREALPRGTLPATAAVAALAAGTPIVVHVTMHFWLDGPQVALAAVAAWLAVAATRRGSVAWGVGAGVALGAAALVKMNAAIAVPGILALAWAAAGESAPRVKARVLAAALAVAFVVTVPWLVAELGAFGTIFPAWAGRPSARLVAENPFVHVVTVVRRPWVYLRILPEAVWSLVPAAALLVAVRPRGRAGRVAVALAFWIAFVVGVNVALGAIGYSKLLRYVVLASPATVLLAGLALDEGLTAARGRKGVALLVALLVLGVGLELAHGVQVARVYPDRAWIRPLFGEPR